jgi:hypothetical protein
MAEQLGTRLPGTVGEVPDSDRKKDVKPQAAWFGGVVLIVLGAIFLLENFGVVLSANWWAAFIYLAAGASFVNMWRQWHAAGFFDSKATGSLAGGLLLATVASIFMFNLSWDIWWPLVLVAIGMGIVIGWLAGAYTGGRSG